MTGLMLLEPHMDVAAVMEPAVSSGQCRRARSQQKLLELNDGALSPLSSARQSRFIQRQKARWYRISKSAGRCFQKWVSSRTLAMALSGSVCQMVSSCSTSHRTFCRIFARVQPAAR